MKEKGLHHYNVLNYYHLPENHIAIHILCVLSRTRDLEYSQLFPRVTYPLFSENISSYREFKKLLEEREYSPRLPQQKIKKLREEVSNVLKMLRDMRLVEYIRRRYSLTEMGKVLAKELCRNKLEI
jgi:hypothetical protein